MQEIIIRDDAQNYYTVNANATEVKISSLYLIRGNPFTGRVVTEIRLSGKNASTQRLHENMVWTLLRPGSVIYFGNSGNTAPLNMVWRAEWK